MKMRLGGRLLLFNRTMSIIYKKVFFLDISHRIQYFNSLILKINKFSLYPMQNIALNYIHKLSGNSE